jgi:arylsulfatase A-like enzyme
VDLEAAIPVLETTKPLDWPFLGSRLRSPMLARLSSAAVVAITLAAAVLPAAQTQTPRPNIVLIVTDDLGYADLGIQGSRDILTPNIDALMRAGTRFSDAYVSGPYCSPTRAGLLTGRYPQRFGHEFNLGVGPKMADLGMPLSEVTIADRLKAARYRTAMYGKWHLGGAGGDENRYHPLSRGFDEFFGFLGGQHSYVSVDADGFNPLLDGRKPATSVSYLTDEIASRGAAFIRKNAASPWFLYLAFNAAHLPMQAPEKYLARFAGIADARRRTYAAMIAAMDDGIGQVMAAVRDARLEERTLVVFLNDNGGPTLAGTTENGASNAPLRGSKRQTWEGGIRVPFAFTWKGRIPADRVVRTPIIQLDVLATVMAAADIPVDASWKLDGVNLLPLMTGRAASISRDTLYWRFGNQMAIRRGDWKLLKASDTAPQAAVFGSIESLAGAELYNLAMDMSETTNVAAANPAKVRELAAAWLTWNKGLATPLWGPGRGGGGDRPGGHQSR